MQNLTLFDLLGALRKRLALLVILPILVAAAALLLCFLLPVQYTATASLFVAVPYEDGGGNPRYDTETGSSLASDYVALFDRSPIVKNTSAALGVADITQAVRFEVARVADTRIVEIKAIGRDAGLCANAATMAANVFNDYLKTYMRIDSVGVTQSADVPRTASFPKPRQYAITAYCVALALCVIAVLLLDQLSNRIRSDTQLTQQLNLSLLASVPDYRKLLKRFLASANERSGRLYRFVPENVRESAKTAAVNISDAAIDATVRTIAVTSVAKGEGKSSLAVLLASAFAEDGKRVLLVDMDMRSPSLSGLLKRQGPFDLTDYLAGRAPLSDVAVRTSYKNLFFIDSHHRAALVSRIVASKRFTSFLDDALTQFDIILFDTSPLSLFIDPAVLAARLDGAVLAVANNKTEVALIQKALDQLSRSKVTVLGAVLNYTKPPKSYGMYYGKGKDKRHLTRSSRPSSSDDE